MKAGTLFKEPIRVDDVRVSTVTVEIQVIRIGTKQMTLAVFRQLPSKNIFGIDGNLRAAPWGWVNYETQWGCKQFVYSYEGGLYRCSVDVQANQKLQVREEIKEEEYAHYDQQKHEYVKNQFPTGRWILEAGGGDYNRYQVGFFSSKLNAQACLENRRNSIAILGTASQLFIAV